MNMNMTKIWAIQLSLAVIVSLGSASCSIKKNVSMKAASTYDSTGTIGIKNLDQLAPSYAMVTGVNLDAPMPFRNNDPLSEQYEAIAPWLSPDGNVESVNSSMLLSITGYAGSVCKLFLANEAAAAAGSRRVYGPVNFAAGPMALSDSILASVHQNLARRCWGRDPSAEESQVLLDSVRSAITALGNPGTTASALSQAAQNALLVSCTAILASPECIKS